MEREEIIPDHFSAIAFFSNLRQGHTLWKGQTDLSKALDCLDSKKEKKRFFDNWISSKLSAIN